MPIVSILVILGVVVAVLVIGGVIITSGSERSLVEERLGRYLEEEEPDKGKGGERGGALTDQVNRMVASSSFGEQLSRSLARADLKFKPGEFVALIAIMVIALGGILWFIGGRNIISLLIGVAAGIVLPMLYLRREQSRRLIKFGDQLPDMINLMVNGLRAGYSTMQALESVSREMPSPLNDEFRRVVQEMQLGVTMERALDNLLRRVPSADLDFIITAINVQREVGGNLAEILDNISHTIRERIRIKGEIRVLTTQVVTSGRILTMIPFFLALALWFVNREYMMEFAKDPLCGGIAIGLALVMIAVGSFVMNKIAKIEV
jgi:tight adherence protein B